MNKYNKYDFKASSISQSTSGQMSGFVRADTSQGEQQKRASDGTFNQPWLEALVEQVMGYQLSAPTAVFGFSFQLVIIRMYDHLSVPDLFNLFTFQRTSGNIFSQSVAMKRVLLGR